jgi:hypothetical protein
MEMNDRTSIAGTLHTVKYLLAIRNILQTRYFATILILAMTILAFNLCKILKSLGEHTFKKKKKNTHTPDQKLNTNNNKVTEQIQGKERKKVRKKSPAWPSLPNTNTTKTSMKSEHQSTVVSWKTTSPECKPATTILPLGLKAAAVIMLVVCVCDEGGYKGARCNNHTHSHRYIVKKSALVFQERMNAICQHGERGNIHNRVTTHTHSKTLWSGMSHMRSFLSNEPLKNKRSSC